MYAGLGVVLITIGAILAFAVNAQVEGLDLNVIGWILMAGGALALIVSAFHGATWMSARRTHTVHERHVSPDGRHVVEEVQTH
jgi:hypothetical protein